MRTPRRATASLVAVIALAAASTLGATASAAAESNPLCSPLIGCDDSDSPGKDKSPEPSAPSSPDTPSKSPTKSPTDPATPEPTETGIPTKSPSAPATPEPTESGTPSAEPTAPVEATKDDDAPVFTDTPASMGSESLSFKGLSGIAIVDVPTADGGTTRTLKISADEIKIEGFSLTVSPREDAGEGGLVTKADTMTLKGNVDVYLGSITATTKNGDSLTIGTDTPPPLDDVEPGLLRVTMGLVGTIADSIEYSNTDQAIVEP